MRVLVDANLPTDVTRVLQRRGFDVRDVRQERPPLPDDRIYAIAKEEGRVILTRDLDFSNILRYPAKGTAGIVVFRVAGLTAGEITERAETFLRGRRAESLSDTLAIVEPYRVRLRRDT